MLQIRDLRVSFSRYRGLLGRERITALDGVDLDLRPGELVALVGASGAGKSLLAHAVLGILPRNAQREGEIHFEDAPLCMKRSRALRGKRIALVPQALTFLDPLARAHRQVRWAALAARRDTPHAQAQAELSRFALRAEAQRRFPHELSGGMARRVMTAIATVSQARLLIADEPTTGLDPQVSKLALDQLRALADEGKGVIVITHDIAAVLPVADRIVVLNEGRSVDHLPAGDFATGRIPHAYTASLRRALPEHGFAAPGTPASAHLATPTASPTAPATGLSAHHIRWQWPGNTQPTLDDAAIDLSPARITGLLGASGGGKTTLARILAGYLKTDCDLRLDGQPLPTRGARPVQLIDQHAELGLHPRMKVGASLREGWQPDAATLERFGIRPEWLGRYPHELSGGELQRIAIVRALVPGLRVLIADELTAMHDAITQAQIWRALRDTLAPRGVAILAISHDEALLRALDARILRLHEGRLIPRPEPEHRQPAPALMR